MTARCKRLRQGALVSARWRSGRTRRAAPRAEAGRVGGLQFAFYGRVSTEDWHR
jgi:hypothetical protein